MVAGAFVECGDRLQREGVQLLSLTTCRTLVRLLDSHLQKSKQNHISYPMINNALQDAQMNTSRCADRKVTFISNCAGVYCAHNVFRSIMSRGLRCLGSCNAAAIACLLAPSACSIKQKGSKPVHFTSFTHVMSNVPAAAERLVRVAVQHRSTHSSPPNFPPANRNIIKQF
jgi:hypothetical protein